MARVASALDGVRRWRRGADPAISFGTMECQCVRRGADRAAERGGILRTPGVVLAIAQPARTLFNRRLFRMKQPDFNGLERLAAGRISGDTGYAVLWPQASLHAERLRQLIKRYEALPRSHRQFHFALTPAAILVSRFRGRERAPLPVAAIARTAA